MKPWIGSALALGLVAVPAYIVWRITRGVESWFSASGAGDVIMWALVAALVLSVFAIPAAAWGLAARMWVVRLEQGQRLESAAHALGAPVRRQLVTVEAEALPAPHAQASYASAGQVER